MREERSLINGSAKETVFLDGAVINGVSGDSGKDVGSRESTVCKLLLLRGDVPIAGVLGGVVGRISQDSNEVWALVTESSMG